MKFKLIDNQGSDWYQNEWFGTLAEIKNSLLLRMECAGETNYLTKTEIKRLTAYDLAELCDFEIEKI